MPGQERVENPYVHGRQNRREDRRQKRTEVEHNEVKKGERIYPEVRTIDGSRWTYPR